MVKRRNRQQRRSASTARTKLDSVVGSIVCPLRRPLPTRVPEILENWILRIASLNGRHEFKDPLHREWLAAH
jgi:hypothetical protein